MLLDGFVDESTDLNGFCKMSGKSIVRDLVPISLDLVAETLDDELGEMLAGDVGLGVLERPT